MWFPAPPCATEPRFPYMWSSPLCSARWMLIGGDPGAHEMGVPSRNGDPWEHSCDPRPDALAGIAPPSHPIPGEAHWPATATRWNTVMSKFTPQRQSKLFISWSVYNLGIKLWLQKGKMTWPRMAMILYTTRENWLQWTFFLWENVKLVLLHMQLKTIPCYKALPRAKLEVKPF